MTSEVPPVEGSQNDDHRTWRLEGDPAKVTLGPPIYPGTCLYVVPVTGALRLEAEAERLRAENERLREAAWLVVARCEAATRIIGLRDFREVRLYDSELKFIKAALGGSQAKGSE